MPHILEHDPVPYKEPTDTYIMLRNWHSYTFKWDSTDSTSHLRATVLYKIIDGNLFAVLRKLSNRISAIKII